jgi:hypothetical protein
LQYGDLRRYCCNRYCYCCCSERWRTAIGARWFAVVVVDLSIPEILLVDVTSLDSDMPLKAWMVDVAVAVDAVVVVEKSVVVVVVEAKRFAQWKVVAAVVVVEAVVVLDVIRALDADVAIHLRSRPCHHFLRQVDDSTFSIVSVNDEI